MKLLSTTPGSVRHVGTALRLALCLIAAGSCGPCDGCGPPPGASCARFEGTWTQSFVCFDEVTATCERDDQSTFTLTDDCGSDVLDTFIGTVAGDTLEWEASEDVEPEGTSDGDYEESGTWRFSNDTMTSESEFVRTSGPNQGSGGPCRANARRGGDPTPVACGDLCDNASNRAEICP